jgi:SAM-dependent methyltransferase
MNWRLKCVAFHVLDKLPFGLLVYKSLQRHVTGRYFQRIAEAKLATPRIHLRHFEALAPGAVALEFGAGRNLLTPLLFSNAGVERIYAYDLTQLATAEQVNDMIAQLRELVPGEWPAIASLDDLESCYRIDDRAPGDARATGLPDRSIDFVYSTGTMEHIPEAELRAILVECIRIAAPGARFSFLIGYHDHYGTTEPGTRWNFYRYSDAQWAKYNPSNHYQNRLRHSDYLRLFTEVGLDILEEERITQEWAKEELARVPLAGRFAHYPREDLTAVTGRFLLAVPNSDRAAAG